MNEITIPVGCSLVGTFCGHKLYVVGDQPLADALAVAMYKVGISVASVAKLTNEIAELTEKLRLNPEARKFVIERIDLRWSTEHNPEVREAIIVDLMRMMRASS